MPTVNAHRKVDDVKVALEFTSRNSRQVRPVSSNREIRALKIGANAYADEILAMLAPSADVGCTNSQLWCIGLFAFVGGR